MVLRIPLGPVLYALIDGFVARIVWAFCIGEARRTALVPITCSEQVALRGIFFLVKAFSF